MTSAGEDIASSHRGGDLFKQPKAIAAETKVNLMPSIHPVARIVLRK
ncbi:hypothetical protein [Microseira wollei]|nr:hypothetical protein [Microseira wollei]